MAAETRRRARPPKSSDRERQLTKPKVITCKLQVFRIDDGLIGDGHIIDSARVQRQAGFVLGPTNCSGCPDKW